MKNKDKVTIEKLKKALKKEDSVFSVYFYRKISLRITRLLVKTNITPNQITLFSLLLGIIAALLFIPGAYTYSIWGVVFLNLSFLMDHVDGEIARYKNLKSLFGTCLDQIVNKIVESSVFIGITIGAYNQINNYSVFIFGILALFNIFMIHIVRAITSQVGFEHRSELKLSKKMHIGSVDTNIFLITIGAIFNLLYYILIFYACFVWLAWVFQIYTRYKRSK